MIKDALVLLGILFVGLKLTDYIDWSWWLVTLPFWSSILLIFVGLFLVFLLEREQKQND